MKKLVSLLSAVCMCLSVGIMLTACENHIHTLTKVDAVAATCETAGNSEYYSCDCGKYFSDANGSTEIDKDSWIIPATGHSYASTWSYNDTHHWKEATCSHSTQKGEYAEHSLTDNACVCGYTITYTVTENKWNEVFVGDYLNNGTVNIDSKYYENEVLIPEQSNATVMKSNETAMVMSMVDGADAESQYLVKEDDVWYAIMNNEGTWYGVEVPVTLVNSYSFAGSQGIAFVDRYNEFTFDDENNCYVASNFVIDSDVTAEYVKIYIKNGKLDKMEMKATINATAYAIAKYVFSDYGTTVIDNIPQWTTLPQEP